MRRSTERIFVSHAGTVPRPARPHRTLPCRQRAARRVRRSTPQRRQRRRPHQAEIGIDIVNDGELSKRNFTNYVRDRLGGLEQPAGDATPRAPPRNIIARDLREFPDSTRSGGGRMRVAPAPAAPPGGNVNPAPWSCTGPITLRRRRDTAQRHRQPARPRSRASTSRASCPPSRPAPSSTGSTTSTTPTDEEFLFAIADALHDEYKAITDAGLNLQIDDPDLPDGWQMFPEHERRRLSQVRRRCASTRSTTRCATSPRSRSACTCAGAAASARTRTTSTLSDIVDIVLKVKAAGVLDRGRQPAPPARVARLAGRRNCPKASRSCPA